MRSSLRLCATPTIHATDDRGISQANKTKRRGLRCLIVGAWNRAAIAFRSYDPRRVSIKVWRNGLSASERVKLNPPSTAVLPTDDETRREGEPTMKRVTMWDATRPVTRHTFFV